MVMKCQGPSFAGRCLDRCPVQGRNQLHNERQMMTTTNTAIKTPAFDPAWRDFDDLFNDQSNDATPLKDIFDAMVERQVEAGHVLKEPCPEATELLDQWQIDDEGYDYLPQWGAAVARQNPGVSAVKELERQNDAVIVGESTPEYEAMLDREITLFVGAHGKLTDWPVVTTSLRALIVGGPSGGFSIHREVRKKGGLCIIPAKFTGTKRGVAAVEELHGIELDFDSGTKRADVEAKIVAHNIAAIVYTTFSDQKAVSEVKRETLFKDMPSIEGEPTTAHVQEWLTHHARGISTDEHIASVEVTDADYATDTGKVVRYSHAPLDKFRVYLPFPQSVKVESIHRELQPRKDAWANKIVGAAYKLLGGHPDLACIDMARVFYMPEHPKGASPSITIFRGKPLAYEDVPSMDKDEYRGMFKPKVMAHKADSLLMPCGTPWTVWAAQNADRLQIATLIENEFPDMVRNKKGDLLEIACPNEEYHSTPGGTGTHVIDADGMGGGFRFGCKHSCPDDRLVLLNDLVNSQPDFEEAWLWEDDENGGYLWHEGEEAEEEPEKTDDTGSEFEDPEVWLPKRYKISKGTIWVKGEDEESDAPICAAFNVVGRSSNEDGTAGAGRIISFKNENGKVVERTISRADIVADGNAVLRDLADRGLQTYGRGKKATDRLLDLLNEITPQRQIPTVTTPGWVRDEHGKVTGFALPTGEYISCVSTRPVRLIEGSQVAKPKPLGTAEKFTDAVVETFKYADTNFYWTLGVATGFAGPLLGLLKERSCGFVYSGHSTLGKTLGQQLGAAVFASPEDGDGLLHSAKSTPNAIEDLCVITTHTTFMFDEIGAFQDKKYLESVLFGMSGGVSKARKKDRNVGLAQRVKYNPFVVMSSEFGIKQEIESGGGKYRAGLVARFPDIDVSGGITVEKASRDIMEAVHHNYGHAGPAFIKYLIDSGVIEDRAKLVREVDAIVSELSGGKAAVIARAAKPFAIAQRAGELAAEAGLLGSDVPAAKNAIRTAVRTAWDVFTQSDEAGAASSGNALVDRITAKLNGMWDRTIISAGSIGSDGSSVGEAEGKDARGTPLGWYDNEYLYLDWSQLEDPAASLGVSVKRAELVKVLGDAVVRKSVREAPQAKLPAHVAQAVDGEGRAVKNLKVERAKIGM